MLAVSGGRALSGIAGPVSAEARGASSCYGFYAKDDIKLRKADRNIGARYDIMPYARDA
jgi:hypothetical protein